MSSFFEKMGVSIEKGQAQSLELIDKLIATARPSAVFSQPVTAGDYTMITAAEVSIGVGFGSGGGGGGAEPVPAEQPATDNVEAKDQLPNANGYGIGMGGGGVSTARPVAAITIGPSGVKVEPIVDATKIAIAMFTTVGAMAFMRSRMQQMSRTGKMRK
jgi:uncharacterized spore protein YtfJ